MTTLLGALFVILAGGGAGLSAAVRLSRTVRLAGRLLELVEWMRLRVSLAHQPLPQALAALCEAYPDLFSKPVRSEELRERSLGELWDGVFFSADLPPALSAPLRKLGGALSGGMEPERAFALCRRELEEAREAFQIRSEGSGRLYIGLGLAAGCMAVILLL